ncbi:MAG: phytanoyl-CoA dioxygenase family protein [Pseudomonadota bacterium]
MLDKVKRREGVWLDREDCDIEAFRNQVSRETLRSDYPNAVAVEGNIPIYDGEALDREFTDEATARAIMAEFHHVFRDGPGIVAVRGGYRDIALVNDVTDLINALIAEEEAAGTGRGDHFAAAGANSRVWNAHEKLCMRDPVLFARYNANEILRRLCEAWLGSGYQITAQVNVVRPGGKAQSPHRDYHMGFQSFETLTEYPSAQHALSAMLTLQGAVAHTKMPIESGPTKLLPYSQTFLAGYLAVLLPEFAEYFEQHFVQLPLETGDMLFFNPATFHAAGENRTSDVQRVANLMQIGSIYGRTTELLDRTRITNAVYPHLLNLLADGVLSRREVDNVVAASAEAYPFPTNLDLDPPIGGMAPPSQQDLVRQALAENWTASHLADAMVEQNGRKRSH